MKNKVNNSLAAKKLICPTDNCDNESQSCDKTVDIPIGRAYMAGERLK